MDSAPDPADDNDASAGSSSSAPLRPPPAATPVETASSAPLRPPPAATPVETALSAPPLAKWLLIYSALRFGLLVVLAAILSLLMPLILALLFAVILALPLSWVIFAGPRRRVNEAMAVSTAHRRAERERLRSALDGPER